MKKLLIILTLLLLGAWVYTSWYWYTCNIKNLCNGVIQKDIQKNENINRILPNATSNKPVVNVPQDDSEDVMIEEEKNTLTTWVNSPEDSPKLSAADVLTITERNISKPEESEDTWEKQGDNVSLTWSLEKKDPEEKASSTEDKDTENTQQDKVVGICESPLVWPIGLGRKNNTDEVKRLESFLISQWEDVNIDGVYGQDDFEAVKAFQLKYREKILDPWDINNPTGYVFRTTVKTINEVACNK